MTAQTGPVAGAGRAERLLAAAGRIRASAVVLPDDALTDPDPDSGERWDRGQVAVLALLDRLDAQALARTGQHQTLGDMTVAEIVDRFAVAHLEEHADQLDPAGRA